MQVEALLGAGDLAGAQPLVDELRVRLGQISHAAEHDSPRRVIGQYHLLRGEVGLAVRFLGDAWTWLDAAYPALASRFIHLRVLLAEAQRRSGQPAAALHTLHGALRASAGGSNFQQSLVGVLAAALLAADLGDHTASRRLALSWDTVRGRLGLPVPIAFETAASQLGIAPVTLPSAAMDSGRQAMALHSCVGAALAWCERQRRPDAAAPATH